MEIRFRLSRLKFSIINLIRDILNLSYYSFWFLFSLRKFRKIKTDEIKNILFITGGAIGDFYNVLGAINSFVDDYNIKVNLLTKKKNRKFVRNEKIKAIDLREAKDLIDKGKIDACIILGATKKNDIIDNGLFKKLKEIRYVVSFELVKITPSRLLDQYFLIFANKKVFPVRTQGPRVSSKLFSLLGFSVKKLRFHFTKEGEKKAENFLKINKLRREEKYVIIHPSSAKIIKALKENKIPAHLWPEERWAKLIDKITSSGIKVILTGVTEEKMITERIYKKINMKSRVVYAVGKLKSIEDVASVVKRAIGTVSIDTSMAHISAQVGTPLVVLYSSRSPREVAPLTNKKIDIYHEDMSHPCRRYACRYCYKYHMKSISVGEVYNDLMKSINQFRSVEQTTLSKNI